MSTTKMNAPSGLSDGAQVTTDFGNYTVSSGTSTVDSRAVPTLLRAGWSVYDDDLEAGKAVRSGSYTVTAGDDTANTVSIPTGLTSIDTMVVMILRSGKVKSTDAAVSISSGNIVVADNSTNYVLTSGDVINWFARGTL